MHDRKAISKRFFSCFPEVSPTELARKIGVTHPTVFQWIAAARQVPWAKLKYLVEAEGVRWDWLLEGREPKYRAGEKPSPGGPPPPFNRSEINHRFLSLFPGMSQARLAELLGITQTAVSAWKLNRRQVPWKKLKYAVDNMGVTWEWLIEGR